MGRECNYCGGEHAESACQANRDAVYENGWASGEASALNERSATIATLRKQLEVATKALNKVHKWQRGEGLLVSVAAAMSDVLADPALRAMVERGDKTK